MTHGARIGSLVLVLALGAGLALMVIGLLFAQRAAALMGWTNAVQGYAIVYIRLRVVGGPPRS